MRTTRIMANLPVADIEAAKSFYTDYLGLSIEEFNLGWVARYTSPDSTANIQLVTSDATAPEDAAISIHTDDVEGAYAEAQQLGYQIVHPLTTESWGTHRFLVRAPDRTVINIVNFRGLTPESLVNARVSAQVRSTDGWGRPRRAERRGPATHGPPAAAWPSSSRARR